MNAYLHCKSALQEGDAEVVLCAATGTGKSSLVNAICLGLAGATQVWPLS